MKLVNKPKGDKAPCWHHNRIDRELKKYKFCQTPTNKNQTPSNENQTPTNATTNDANAVSQVYNHKPITNNHKPNIKTSITQSADADAVVCAGVE